MRTAVSSSRLRTLLDQHEAALETVKTTGKAWHKYATALEKRLGRERRHQSDAEGRKSLQLMEAHIGADEQVTEIREQLRAAGYTASFAD